MFILTLIHLAGDFQMLVVVSYTKLCIPFPRNYTIKLIKLTTKHDYMLYEIHTIVGSFVSHSSTTSPLKQL
jgi:hypothetical protein